MTAQLLGIFPPDPELSRPTQELFEQFFEEHGLPNDAESDLLQAVGYVDAGTVDAWCTFDAYLSVRLLIAFHLVTWKVFRLRGSWTLLQKMREIKLGKFNGSAISQDSMFPRSRSIKPYSRH